MYCHHILLVVILQADLIYFGEGRRYSGDHFPYLVDEVDAFREEEKGVDEDHPDLVQKTRFGDRVEDNAIAGDQRRGKYRVLFRLPRRSSTGRTRTRFKTVHESAHANCR